MTMIASYNWESDSFTQHTATPARVTFREAVLQVADKAKAVLPDNASRIDKAIALTLNGLVETVDGKCRVASQTNGKTIYHQVNGTCTCQDFTQEKAPNGFCKHRLAHGLYRRAMELVKANEEKAKEVISMASVLPEAAASANAYILINGHRVQITLRDHHEGNLLTRMTKLLSQFPVVEEKPAQPKEGWCALHNTQMKQRNGKNGKAFWSHQVDGQWCHGK